MRMSAHTNEPKIIPLRDADAIDVESTIPNLFDCKIVSPIF